MKVTLQESLSRAGIPHDQYALQQQQLQVDNQQPATSTSAEASTTDMGRVPALGETYAFEQFSALFGGPDNDQDDIDDSGSPSHDEYEAFVRMLTGVDIPSTAQSGYAQPNDDVTSAYPSQSMIYTEEAASSPALSFDAPRLQEALAVDQSQEAESRVEASDSDSINSQPKVRRKTTQKISRSPDTSTIRPVKSKPVDVDNVLERNRKNAIQARLNRQRKKEQMEHLEGTMAVVQRKNEELEKENLRLRDANVDLQEELSYVKNVLANQSMLAGLLKNVGHPEPAVLSSFPKQKSEINEERPRKVGGGLCVHIDKEKVSIEMCAKCSQMAQTAT